MCTLFGLLPLALGLGAELRKPLALAVIGGLSLSTLVTLYLVPSAYVRAGQARVAFATGGATFYFTWRPKVKLEPATTSL